MLQNLPNLRKDVQSWAKLTKKKEESKVENSWTNMNKDDPSWIKFLKVELNCIKFNKGGQSWT